MSQKQAKRLRQAQRKATGVCELDRRRKATVRRAEIRRDVLAGIEWQKQRDELRRALRSSRVKVLRDRIFRVFGVLGRSK